MQVAMHSSVHHDGKRVTFVPQISSRRDGHQHDVTPTVDPRMVTRIGCCAETETQVALDSSGYHDCTQYKYLVTLVAQISFRRDGQQRNATPTADPRMAMRIGC